MNSNSVIPSYPQPAISQAGPRHSHMHTNCKTHGERQPEAAIPRQVFSPYVPLTVPVLASVHLATFIPPQPHPLPPIHIPSHLLRGLILRLDRASTELTALNARPDHKFPRDPGDHGKRRWRWTLMHAASSSTNSSHFRLGMIFELCCVCRPVQIKVIFVSCFISHLPSSPMHGSRQDWLDPGPPFAISIPPTVISEGRLTCRI